MHSLLRRQLKRRSIECEALSADWQAFVAAVDEAYVAFHADRLMLERSLDLSSQELLAANRQMRSAEELLRATLESTVDGILAMASDGRVIYANDRFAELWRLLAEVTERRDVWAIGEYVLDQLVDPAQFEARVREVLATTEESFDAFTFTDGRTFERYSRPLIIPDGVSGRVFSFRDVTERLRADSAMKESEQRFRALVQNSSDMIVIMDAAATIIYASPSVERIMGYTSEDVRGVEIASLLHPEDLQRGAQSLAGVLAESGVHPPAEIRLRHRDGSWRDVDLVANNMLSDPAVGGIVLNARDVTERKAAEAALKQSEERFRSLVQNGSDVITVVNDDYIITYQSPSLESVLGYPAERTIGRKFTNGVHLDDVGLVLGFLNDSLGRRDGAASVEARARHADGSWRHMEFVGSDLRDDPAVAGFVLNVRDITERKNLEHQLRHQAFHDPLTSLANRARFTDRLEHALARTVRTPAQLAVLFMDIDNFKSINDALGHAAGDLLLVRIAERVQASLRPGDTAARFGGDEFALLLEDLASPSDAEEVAARIVETLRRPFDLDGTEVFVQASIGVALSGVDRASVDGLLRNADVAMYVAKGRGKARVELYQDSMHVAMHERLRLLAELQRAVERHQFVLQYQPVIELSTGIVLGFEALVRWDHPVRGLLPPSDFITLAEEGGVIHALGRWVLREACRQMTQWQAEFRREPPLYMSVNVSGHQMQPGIVEEVQSALADSGLPPSSLTLELTESVVMRDVPSTIALLGELKGLGVRLAIDDFGTGFSSLSYLRQFPFDILKIDKSFVDDVGSPSDQELTPAIVEIGRTLGLELVAEGIERIEQLQRLRSLACEVGQGYYFAKPLFSRDIAALLNEDPLRNAAA